MLMADEVDEMARIAGQVDLDEAVSAMLREYSGFEVAHELTYGP